jgi:hypothetical protein
MASKPWIPTVVYDACVLYPFALKNVLIQCAMDRLVRARWTQDIHGEWIGNLLKRRPDLTRDRLERTRMLMDQAVPDALVTDYHHLIPTVSIADLNDRHVVAAAIKTGAQAIVSADRHFRNDNLKSYQLEVWRPDAFLTMLYRSDNALMIASAANARRNLSRSLPTVTGFIDSLQQGQNLPEFCNTLRRHTADL